ncbi:MAG: 1-deoxy-D-xylulose-5-phosphate synthase [Treponemataceae bacterium]|nr:1-deoxy-D-xylulose-5-phosphate synthase [Treponemataceae bacterium]
MELHTILSGIHSPDDLKKVPAEKLPALAEEIRRTIIEVVGNNGGHLASNLGVVELTVALHRTFRSPDDAIIWDVSHQCYAHKILTGRYGAFSSLRKAGGIAGFTKKAESPHDFFDAGHSSTSISSALGLLAAWDIRRKDGHVVAVIGDGALTGGMAYEALSNAGQLGKRLIVVVNDNQMSIDLNTGAISRYLSRLTVTSAYQRFRKSVDAFVARLPLFNRVFGKFIFRFKRALKGMFFSDNLFADLGFEYTGPFDGHDERTLEQVFARVRRIRRPVIVHVVTKKGKGYSPAEDHPERFHGVGPFCISGGEVEKFDALSFTEAFSGALMALAGQRDDIACVTAAMAKGTGLDTFARHYPDRFFDVGIAEEHAVTFAGGLAAGGLLPVVCIYSTFMQRAVDQVIHDVALQKLPVILVLDRAGPVPGDGETHQGLFDIALFRPVPGLAMLCPSGAADLRHALDYAAAAGGPVVIRYPKMTCPSEQDAFDVPYSAGRGILVSASEFEPALEGALESGSSSPKILFVTTGGMYSEVRVAARGVLLRNAVADIYAVRFVKPFDEDYFLEVARKYDGLVFVEDGVRTGGLCERLAGLCAANGMERLAVKAFPEEFLPQGTRAEICARAGMAPEDLTAAALSLVPGRGA